MGRKKTQKCSGNTNRARTWCITAWKEPVYDSKQMKYLIYGKEFCPKTQKLHYQTFVYYHNAKTFSAMAKKWPGDHFVVMDGDIDENIAYCSKDEDYKEFGKPPEQGKRVDLLELAEEVRNGRSVDDICMENPNAYHVYGRTLNKIEDICLRNKYRTTMTKGTWYWGETNVGKSHEAFKDFTPNSHYVLPKDKGWWDGYKGQETVIINDFRGHIPYDEMLQLIDKWPHWVSRRGREPIPFTSKHVIITSPLTPEEVYHNREEHDNIKQLLRRLNVIELKKRVEAPGTAYFN